MATELPVALQHNDPPPSEELIPAVGRHAHHLAERSRWMHKAEDRDEKTSRREGMRT